MTASNSRLSASLRGGKRTHRARTGCSHRPNLESARRWKGRMKALTLTVGESTLSVWRRAQTGAPIGRRELGSNSPRDTPPTHASPSPARWLTVGRPTGVVNGRAIDGFVAA